jgi:DNA repair protein RadC
MAASIFKEYIGNRDREVFAVIGVDTGNEPTFLNIVSIGQLGEVRANMRELFQSVILSSSALIIIGHNHPGGSMKPSEEDPVITEKIKKVGKMLGISLLDHIIVSTADTMSIREKRPDLFG